MNHIAAVGFDLIHTLVVIQPHTSEISLQRLIQSLQKSGFLIDHLALYEAYKKDINLG